MRNNNPDIIIHSLVDRKLNKEDSSNPKYDYMEEISIDNNRRDKLAKVRRKQAELEQTGNWVSVTHTSGKYLVLVCFGEDEASRINHFIEKLDKRPK
jgi:hypothetical protein